MSKNKYEQRNLNLVDILTVFFSTVITFAVSVLVGLGSFTFQGIYGSNPAMNNYLMSLVMASSTTVVVGYLFAFMFLVNYRNEKLAAEKVKGYKK